MRIAAVAAHTGLLHTVHRSQTENLPHNHRETEAGLAPMTHRKLDYHSIGAPLQRQWGVELAPSESGTR